MFENRKTYKAVGQNGETVTQKANPLRKTVL
jgi:hypothetical protein